MASWDIRRVHRLTEALAARAGRDDAGREFALELADQLNGGAFADLTPKDWRLIRPYLETNERLFGISVERGILTVEGTLRPCHEVYRKVVPVKLGVLARQAVPE